MLQLPVGSVLFHSIVKNLQHLIPYHILRITSLKKLQRSVVKRVAKIFIFLCCTVVFSYALSHVAPSVVVSTFLQTLQLALMPVYSFIYISQLCESIM